MKLNLDTMRSEIQDYLETRGMVVFHPGFREKAGIAMLYWDTEGHPDYHAFLGAAENAGVRLITLWANDFSDDLIDDALDRLQTSSLPRDDRRTIQTRLGEMRAYSGFTCQIELSFDLGSRVYIFDLRTDWYDDLNDLLDRIDAAYDGEDEDSLSPGDISSKKLVKWNVSTIDVPGAATLASGLSIAAVAGRVLWAPGISGSGGGMPLFSPHHSTICMIRSC